MTGAIKAAQGTSRQKASPMDSFWSDQENERRSGEPEMVVDIDGFEGPLDLLLHLARTQKVDLARISTF